jgi:hypothetical protein
MPTSPHFRTIYAASSASNLTITSSKCRTFGQKLRPTADKLWSRGQLGIEGLGDTRDNFVTIELDRQHRATLEWDGVTYLLETAPIIALGERSIPAARCWQPPKIGQPGDAGLLSSLLGLVSESVPASFLLLSSLPSSAEPVPESVVLADTAAVSPGSERQAQMIHTLLAASYSANDIAALLGGNRATALAKIRAARSAHNSTGHV